jgi:hypothetical protein
VNGYETVATLDDLSVARVLVIALRAHGFHPREEGDGGLPGLPRAFGAGGYPVDLPDDEAADGRLLAEALLRDMLAR